MIAPLRADRFKPRICNRLSITALTLFESIVSLRLSSRHSDAMLSKSNFLILCDLKLHHEFYPIIRVSTIIKRGFNNCSERGEYQESSELKMLNRHVRATKV